LEQACKLLDDLREWETTTDPAARRKAWGAILQANADEAFSIGTVNGIRQPIVVGLTVRNVPKEGYYAWEPGGYTALPARHVLDRSVRRKHPKAKQWM
jgi:peptide/nickel transport system substrate-binding protein